MLSASDSEIWDHIVIGAGSAGCAIAARLSAADRRVLLLEAGGPDRGRWLHIPLGVGRIIHDGRVVWQFRTEPESAAGGRRMYWPRGKVLGGSSSVNGMIWVRGDPHRYDEWGDAGCPGWDWQSMEPVLRGIESFPAGEAGIRGHGGPVSIETHDGKDSITDAFIEACCGLGIPANPDYNGRQFEGVGRLQVSTRRGRRCSTAVAYLRPNLNRERLRSETRALAHRVVFEGRRATGVEFMQSGQLRCALSRRDIILAAGTIQSPQLLELSGIGDARRLRELGIPVVADLPAVGENLSDHYHVRVTYRSRGAFTVNDLLRRPWWYGPPAWLEYQLRGSGVFAGVSATAHALARALPDAPYPDTKLQLHKISGADNSGTTAETGIDPFSGVSIGFFQLYPESRGHVHVVSTDPLVAPRIVVNYLTAPNDRAAVLRGLRLARRIGAQPVLQRFLVQETRPGSESMNDEALLEYASRAGQTSYHPVGTCRMGSDPDSVVDPSCRVRHVDGLRVADASVMPFIVSSNTNAPAIAIGERAAQILLSEANN